MPPGTPFPSGGWKPVAPSRPWPHRGTGSPRPASAPPATRPGPGGPCGPPAGGGCGGSPATAREPLPEIGPELPPVRGLHLHRPSFQALEQFPLQDLDPAPRDGGAHGLPDVLADAPVGALGDLPDDEVPEFLGERNV